MIKTKLGFIGILFQLLGILLILFFQIFMQKVYIHKTTITGDKIILMIVPENRFVLWIGFILLISGFLMFFYKEFFQIKSNE